MPPAVAPGTLVRARLITTMQNQIAENVLDWTISVVNGPLTAVELADAISTGVGQFLVPWLATLARYKGLILQLTSGNQVGAQIITTVGTATGPPGSDPQPKQISGLISKFTDLAGRAHRGRMYVPFPAKDIADTTGAPTAAQVGLLQDLATQLFTTKTYLVGVNSATLIPIIRHKNPAIPTDTVTRTTTPQKWATQRRRGDFGKPNPSPI